MAQKNQHTYKNHKNGAILNSKELQMEVTDWKMLINNLKEVKILFDAILTQSPVPIVVINKDETIRLINHAAGETLGYFFDETKPGIKFKDFDHLWQTFDAAENPVPIDQTPIISALTGKITKGKEFKIVRKDDTERWQVVDALPIYDEKNEIIAAFAIFQDITDRKHAKDALQDRNTTLEQAFEERTAELHTANQELKREIEERNIAEIKVQDIRNFAESIIDTVRDPLVVLDASLKVISASRSFYKTFRLTPAQIQGKLFYTINNNQWDIPQLRSLLEKILPKHIYFENFEIEHRFDCIGPKILHLNARRIYNKKDNAEFILLVFEDATEQILSRRINAELEEKTKVIKELTLIGHWELDLVRNTLFWSNEIYTMFDLEPRKFDPTYENFLERVHPDDRNFVDESYKESLKNKTTYDIIHRLLLPDGTIKYVHEKCKTEYDEAGNPVRSLGTVQDITRLKRKGDSFAGIVGRTHRMKALFATIKELADVNIPVLIQGESGTGKELVAYAIHNNGPRSKKPFVPVNCSALPEGLIESELFGHVKGAFTGAMRDKRGRFELADGGTLFLDEVADLPKSVQAKLLRVLQEGTFENVGGEKTISVDVRIISAANRDLKNEVKKGYFRDDLYYRINVVPIDIPPLRDRKNDIPLLVESFLSKFSEEGQRSKGISKSALSIMIGYPWPGNVRELQSAIRFALVKSRGEKIEAEHLPEELKQSEKFHAARTSTGKLNKTSVNTALDQAAGNKSKAAKILGVGRATLYRFLSENRDMP